MRVLASLFAFVLIHVAVIGSAIALAAIDPWIEPLAAQTR